ncbi:hypothetical protein [Ralstonia pseudosolanacearum]|uniref:hypothetical protein n=1 Tax=Ralstonia pseudosolanacearum TaxID=1310165 RepID=UPI001FF8FF0B|nr:hypothetical protein [Ralstonia pseudosolanacearum]
MEEILLNKSETIGLQYSTKQAEAFKMWIQRFGAADSKELDLGVLMAIHEWVMDGRVPTDQNEGR